MKVHYVGCFDDSADSSLIAALNTWQLTAGRVLTQGAATTADDFRIHLESLPKEDLDVLIVGGHGHPSLAGFWVHDDPVRWHDLAFLLRGQLPRGCTFIFYSCDGGYPGIMHIFGREEGPDFVFGPRIKVLPDAMTHATMEVLNWKALGGGDVKQARKLVDAVHAWAVSKYPGSSYDHEFLRVMWCEGPRCRYPNSPGPDKPDGSSIPLRGWNL